MPRKPKPTRLPHVWYYGAKNAWVAQKYLGKDENGKPRQWRAYAKTQEEAAAKLRDFEALLEREAARGEGAQLLGDYLDDWLATLVARGKRASTVAFYRGIVTRYLRPALGTVPLDRLTPQHVDDVLSALAKQPKQRQPKGAEGVLLSPRTVAHCRSVLRAALNRARSRLVISYNAAALAEPVHVPSVSVEPLSVEDATRVLAALDGHPLRALYTVVLALGLRQGEALGLRWSDLDLDHAELRTRVGLVPRDGGGYALEELKTHQSRGTLALPAFAVAALRDRWRVQKEQERDAGPRWKGCAWDLVFTTEVGTPVGRRNLDRQWKRLLEKAGVADARFYDLRHTCASLLFAQGLNPREVMEILRHSQISLTMDTYTHIYQRGRRRGAEVMEGLFGESGGGDARNAGTGTRGLKGD